MAVIVPEKENYDFIEHYSSSLNFDNNWFGYVEYLCIYLGM